MEQIISGDKASMPMTERFYSVNGQMMGYESGGVKKDFLTDHLGSITAEAGTLRQEPIPWSGDDRYRNVLSVRNSLEHLRQRQRCGFPSPTSDAQRSLHAHVVTVQSN